MSWGDSQYGVYLSKLKERIKKEKLYGKKLDKFLNDRWYYVNKHANLEKIDFISDCLNTPRR